MMKIRTRLALLPLVVVLLAQCADDPTSPGATPVDATPSFAVASLAPISALEGTPVQLYCGTSSDAEGDPLLCQWDFENDGLVDAECNTADGMCRWDFDHDGAWDGSRAGSFDYVWPDDGTFDVRLDVTDATGDHSSTVAQATVADVPPFLTGRQGLVFPVGEVQRAQTRFADPGADGPWTFVFDFGDGTVIGPRYTPGPDVGFGQFHAYSEVGTYTITVTVTDKDGVTGTLVRTVQVVNNTKPVAVANGPYVANEGDIITLSSAGTTDDQSSLSYVWYFSDGSRSMDAHPSKRFNDNGTYTALLVVTDPAGAADSAEATIEVHNVAPNGFPRVPNTREGQSFSLSINGTDPSNADRQSLEYMFDCGQGAGPTAWSTTNGITCDGLPDQGTHTVWLGVRDKDGGETIFERTMNVMNSQPVTSLTPASSTTIQVGGSVTFEGRFSDAGADDGPFTYLFAWGDGRSEGGTTPTTTEAAPLTASHTYTRTGTFNVIFLVTDKDGAPQRSMHTVTVTP